MELAAFDSDAFAHYNRLALGIVMSASLTVAGFNFAMDPMWCFAHQHRFNSRQVGTNERQQKTNFLFHREGTYDAILLGSSRTTYIDQFDFKGWRVFNYGASGMAPEEYAGFLANARASGRWTGKLAILGLDFFGTDAAWDSGNGADTPAACLSHARDPLYPFKLLMSLSVASVGVRNVRNALTPCENDWYDRYNVKSHIRRTPAEVAHARDEDLAEYAQRYGRDYRYKPALRAMFGELVRENPGTRFLVFTTPESRPLLDLMVTTGHRADYGCWLGDAVAAFGQVIHFDYPNAVTNTPANYYDAHHFRPAVGRLIARRLQGGALPEMPEFGMRLDAENLPSGLAWICRRFEREARADRALKSGAQPPAGVSPTR